MEHKSMQGIQSPYPLITSSGEDKFMRGATQTQHSAIPWLKKQFLPYGWEIIDRNGDA